MRDARRQASLLFCGGSCSHPIFGVLHEGIGDLQVYCEASGGYRTRATWMRANRVLFTMAHRQIKYAATSARRAA